MLKNNALKTPFTTPIDILSILLFIYAHRKIRTIAPRIPAMNMYILQQTRPNNYIGIETHNIHSVINSRLPIFLTTSNCFGLNITCEFFVKKDGIESTTVLFTDY